MRKGERRQDKTEGGWLGGMSEFLKGGALAGIVSLFLLLVFAVLISAGVIGERWLDTLVMLGCGAGSFTGGAYVIGREPDRPVLKGAGVGLVMYLILLTSGMIIYGGVSVERGGRLLAAALCAGALSSLTARGKKKRKRKSRG